MIEIKEAIDESYRAFDIENAEDSRDINPSSGIEESKEKLYLLIEELETRAKHYEICAVTSLLLNIILFLIVCILWYVK